MGRVVLVTGVARDLAARFARQLAENTNEIDKVVGIDVVPPPGDRGGVKFVRADIRTPVVAKVLAVEEVDTVVHMGLVPSQRGTSVRGSAAKELNVIGTMQLLAACQRASSVDKLVVQSSTAVYGTSPSDPAMFTESSSPRGGVKSGFPKDVVEAEGYIRGFARRRTDILITTLRMANILSHRVVSPFGAYYESAVLPTVMGFDPRVQLLHELDALNVLSESVIDDRPGTFNVAGDGVLLLSQTARRLGKPMIPLPPIGFGGAASRLIKLMGSNIPTDLYRLLKFGRVVDTAALRDIFGYEPLFTTEQTFEAYRQDAKSGILATLGGRR